MNVFQSVNPSHTPEFLQPQICAILFCSEQVLHFLFEITGINTPCDFAGVPYDCDALSLRHNRDLPGSQWPDKFCRIQCCAPGMVQHLLLAANQLSLNHLEDL